MKKLSKASKLFAKWRKRQSLTFRSAAELFNVSHSAIHLWETGQGLPTGKHAVLIKKHSKIAIEDWFT